MRSVVFDDRGEMWDAQSRTVWRDDLHASIDGEELVDYAVRNLGFVAVKEMGGSLRISLRPAVVSPIAFSALLYWLHDRPVDRVLVSFFDREWSHEMLRSRAGRRAQAAGARRPRPRRARGRLPAARAAARTACRKPRRCEACSTSGRSRAASSIASGWRRCSQRALNGRFVLVEASPERPSHGHQGCRRRPHQARRVLAVALHRQSRRGPARLRLRQVGGQALPRGGGARRAEPRATSTRSSTGRSSRAGASATGA